MGPLAGGVMAASPLVTLCVDRLRTFPGRLEGVVDVRSIFSPHRSRLTFLPPPPSVLGLEAVLEPND
jgi:hypothetical protein